MNSTRPIILKKHITQAQGMALKESGIQLVTVNFTMIANCRTAEEEARVNALNETLMEKVIDEYYWPDCFEEKHSA